MQDPAAGSSLQAGDPFVTRHIGPDEASIEAMLGVVGATSLDDLVDRTLPASIRTARPLSLPAPATEAGALAELRGMADANVQAVSMIGQGYYGTLTPPVILRNLLENAGWYTAYTPYQAEVSQGRLEALLNWQQMVCDLTGLEIANASLLDEATAAAEAMTLARRVAKSRSSLFIVDADTHPQTVAVVRTRAAHLGIEVVVAPLDAVAGHDAFGVLLSYPGSSGAIRDLRPTIEAVHARGGIVAVASDVLALVLLTPPGELGADIALGSAQRFGVPMGYGGPHAAFFATRDAHKRSMPGRLIGVSVDSRGKPALRMALQTREQHIRREKATSNICTAQVLLAVIAGMYAVWHGPDGLRRIAGSVHRKAQFLKANLAKLGVATGKDGFFDTLTLQLPGKAAELVAAAGRRGINLRPVDADRCALSIDETTPLRALLDVLAAAAEALGKALEPVYDDAFVDTAGGIPASFARRSGFLDHPVFHSHRSETQMMRYLRRLQGKDVALDRSMIPLGSCTMKLNAAAEMIPVTWAGFGALHPFAPADQARGYATLFADLERWLCEITGFDAVSLQPNAGSQGEYAGLLAIRRYHDSRDDRGRDVCLIPSSAHGTNPASAVMAGMSVVVVGCDATGNIDVADLIAKADQHRDRLAALMVTYPSTHGVYEERIKEICALVHERGGQVYMDGANLNALVGLARPAELGADVSHMNLHKTFCIPHGGGGPGMGPIGVRAHLAPFLPGHPVVDNGGPDREVAVSAAPWGSASILPISWAYIRMMGGPGLTRATQVAILNANYVARRLAPHFPVVYTGQNGMVAHECIIDLRGIKEATGITAEDVAKRLVDFGFHAPTMSWPVPETMMVEPTESEDKAELDRFCDAMIRIRAEIAAIEQGRADARDNVLKHAPHTADLLVGSWSRPYSREEAFFALPWIAQDKYWPPVGRVDNVHGDRHLVCSCPPVEAYALAAE